MNIIKQLLQDADPLRHERTPSEVENALSDAATAIAAAASLNPPPIPALGRRRLLVIAVVVLIIGASLVGPRKWLPFVQKSHASVPFEVRLAEDVAAPGLIEARVVGDGRPVYLHEEVVVANGDITSAYLVQDARTSGYSVGVEFTSDAAQRMHAATESHMGRPLAILIGNEVVVALKVRSPISGSAVITGNFTKSEAERIAVGIQ